MTDKQWIFLLVIIAIVYYLLTRPQSYPAFPSKPSPPPSPEPQPKPKTIHVTVIHPNGSSTSTYFPIEAWNGEEDGITIHAQRLGINER